MATTMGVKLDERVRDRLKAMGRVKDRTPHWLMKTAILEYLEREERLEAERQEEMSRWAEYRRTGEYISNDAMMDWLKALPTEEDPRVSTR